MSRDPVTAPPAPVASPHVTVTFAVLTASARVSASGICNLWDWAASTEPVRWVTAAVSAAREKALTPATDAACRAATWLDAAGLNVPPPLMAFLPPHRAVPLYRTPAEVAAEDAPGAAGRGDAGGGESHAQPLLAAGPGESRDWGERERETLSAPQL